MKNSREEQSHQLRTVLNTVYTRFHTSGTWPSYGALEEQMYQSIGIADLRSLLLLSPRDTIIFEQGQIPVRSDSVVALTLNGIAMCPGSEDDVRLLLDSISLLRTFYDNTILRVQDPLDRRVLITREQYLAELQKTTHGSFWLNGTKFINLTKTNPAFVSDGISVDSDGGWTLTISPFIRRWNSPTTAKEYYEQKAQISASFSANVSDPFSSQDLALNPAPLEDSAVSMIPHAPDFAPSDLDEVVRDRIVFVVMPFQEKWSSDVYDFIRTTLKDLDHNYPLRIVRADEVSKTGLIVPQILNLIDTAELIIADVTPRKVRTGLRKREINVDNGNVFWELGYAFGAKRPLVILSQCISDAPFDIKLIRSVEYHFPPNDQDAERLRSAVNDNLGIPVDLADASATTNDPI